MIVRRVEWVDTDASGHHHNGAVMRWFEVAPGGSQAEGAADDGR